jgi:tripartite-type tricarboxylate transporter receptor subunit TctC
MGRLNDRINDMQMRFCWRQLLGLAVMACTLAATVAVASAQAYPMRPITMIVAFGAGGPSDIIGRILAEGMRGTLGQPVIVENVTGASGTIGTGRAARAEPDGYTFELGNFATHVLNGPLFSLSYDIVKDFEPVSLVCADSLLIVGRKTLPADNLKEFVAWLKANPDQATQGTTGAGGISTVGGLFFRKQTGTRFRSVPYRQGLTAAMQDLVAGRIDFMVDNTADSLPQIRAGTIKAFAVMARHRLAAAPEIPTVDEAGLPNLNLYAVNWQGAFLPKGAPKEVVAKLNEAIVTALADSAAQRRLAEIGQEVFPRDQQTPQVLAAFQQADIAKWWPIVKDANIKGN